MTKFERGSISHRLELAARVRLVVELDAMAAKCLPIFVRSVLGELLRHAGTSGVCWPSTRRIAANLEISRSTACKALAAIIGLGLVHRERRAFSQRDGELGRSTKYHLCWLRLDQLARIESVDATAVAREDRKAGQAPVRRARERPYDGHGRPCDGRASARRTDTNLLIEPSPLPPMTNSEAEARPASTEAEAEADQLMTFSEAIVRLASGGHPIAQRYRAKRTI